MVGLETQKVPEPGRAGMSLDEKQILLTLTHFSLGLASTCLQSNLSDTFDINPAFLPFIDSSRNVDRLLDARCTKLFL